MKYEISFCFLTTGAEKEPRDVKKKKKTLKQQVSCAPNSAAGKDHRQFMQAAAAAASGLHQSSPQPSLLTTAFISAFGGRLRLSQIDKILERQVVAGERHPSHLWHRCRPNRQEIQMKTQTHERACFYWCAQARIAIIKVNCRAGASFFLE